jgi:hypothetical protein
MKRNTSDRDRDDMSSQEIIAIVEEIRASPLKQKEKESAFERKYPEFYKSYSAILQMACQPDFDREQFAYMMAMRERIREKNISFDEASKEVGQNLYDKFVKPVIEK